MKKYSYLFNLLAIFALLTCLLLFPVVALHAEEGASKGGEKAKAESSEKAEKKEAKKEGEGGKEGGKKDKDKDKDNTITGGRFDGDPVYVHLRPLLLPVVTQSGAEQLVTMIVDLRVTDLKVANELNENMPRVRDALMQELYGGLGTGVLRNGTLVDVGKLKSKIMRAMVKLRGEGDVQEVLIESLAQRKL